MSKKIQLGLDLIVNVNGKDDLFDLGEFQKCEFYNEFVGWGARRNRAYNILEGDATARADKNIAVVWSNTKTKALSCVGQFNDTVLQSEALDFSIELADCTVHEIGMNATVFDFYNERCVTFDTNMVIELVYTITLHGSRHLTSGNLTTEPRDVANALEQHVRNKLDDSASVRIAFIEGD